MSNNSKGDIKQLFLRKELSESNKQTVVTPPQIHVEKTPDFDIFQSNSFQGLFKGLGSKGIYNYKGVKKEKDLGFSDDTEVTTIAILIILKT